MMQDSTNQPIELIYFADPMCSWCWAFAPVIQKLLEQYGQRLNIEVIAGGLRAYETRGMTAEMREKIQGHWRHIAEATNQPFQFDGALPNGFVYDTEPACRALVTVREMAPELALRYLHELHAAFYADGKDITNGTVLARIATDIGIDAEDFTAKFTSQPIVTATAADFESRHDNAVMGFPTLLLKQGESRKLVSNGYQPIAAIIDRLEALMPDCG